MGFTLFRYNGRVLSELILLLLQLKKVQMMIVQALSAATASLRLAIYNRRLRWLVKRRAIRAVLMMMMMVVMQMVFTARHQFRIRSAAAAIARV